MQIVWGCRNLGHFFLHLDAWLIFVGFDETQVQMPHYFLLAWSFFIALRSNTVGVAWPFAALELPLVP
jgi:hypothetical protein